MEFQFLSWALLSHNRETLSPLVPLGSPLVATTMKQNLKQTQLGVLFFFLPHSWVTILTYERKNEELKTLTPSCYLDQQRAFVCNSLWNAVKCLQLSQGPWGSFANFSKPKNNFTRAKILRSLRSSLGSHPTSHKSYSLFSTLRSTF